MKVRKKQILRRLPRILKGTWFSFIHNEGFIRACAITYATLFAIVPFLILLTLIAGNFGYWDLVQNMLPKIIETTRLELPMETIRPILERTQNFRFGSLGVIGVLSLGISFLSAMSNLESNMNVVWGLEKDRNIFRRLIMYAPLMLVLVLFILFLGFLLAEFRDFIGAVPLVRGGSVQEFLEDNSFTAVFFTFAWSFLFILYWLIPNTRVQLFPAAFSATTTLFLLFSVTWASVSLQKFFFARLYLLYGSLSFVPFLMLVVYIAWILVLLGNAFTFRLQTFLKTHIYQ
jgi:membrane protein